MQATENIKTDTGIAEDSRCGVVTILNNLLADEYVLYTKTRNYHWNVTGPQFNDLHEFFEEQYEALNKVIDDVAERVRAVNGMAFGTLSEFSGHTRLSEQPGQCVTAGEMLVNLLADHEGITRTLRADLVTCDQQYQDMGTSDFITGLLGQHEKMAWKLRSFLQG